MKLIKATIENLESLRHICIDTYKLNFKHHWIKNGFDLFIKKEFSIERLTSDLNSEYIDYYFIDFENKHVGFLKIKTNLTSAKADCELIKLYILPEYKGKGIGKFALLSII